MSGERGPAAGRAPVSACLITFNEEGNLRAALESIAFADEIIVVDSHSTDATREIAARFRGEGRGGGRNGMEVIPRVIERDWPGHVEQKNFAIDQASNEWVLCIDADERVSEELRREIEAALSRDAIGALSRDAMGAPSRGNIGAPPAGYEMARRTRYLGRWIRWGGWYPDRKVRLFRRSAGRWGGVNPHDHVRVDGRVERLKGDLLHHSYRSLADHVRTINSFTDIAAQEKSRMGVRWPLLRMAVHPPFKFLKMFVLQLGFREGTAGLIMAAMGAFYVFLKYAKLWELAGREWRDVEPARTS